MAGVDWERLLMETSGLAIDSQKAELELARAREEIDRESERSKKELLAWQDRVAPQRSTFDAEAAASVAKTCRASAHLRLSPERRRAIVERVVGIAGGRVQPISTDPGVVRVAVPQRLRFGVPEVIERAVFDPAHTPRGARGVELLAAQHPLLQAIGVAARAALHDPGAPLASARLSAKIADVPNAGVLFTFAVRFMYTDGETYAEELLPVFVPEGMPIEAAAAIDHELFDVPEQGGTPHLGAVERLRAITFIERRAEAVNQAIARAALRAQEFSTREETRSVQLAADVERWSVAKRKWLEDQLAPAGAQMPLILDTETAAAMREDDEAYRRQRRRFEQELETLDIAARERLDEIAKHRQVLAPDRVELVGALFMVPIFETTGSQ
jgi:hypothetical protein